MDELLVVVMSRWQFAVTVITHFLFVPTTIGLLTATVIFESIFAFGKGKENEHYGRLALFFAKLAFLSFASGVVTGLVMELQFGMNWSAYSRFFGDVIGVSVALEGLTAFFLESTLMGLWRFTWGKIDKKLHVIFGGLLLLTTLFSVFWIISVNAFMQNPVGFHMEGDTARLDSVFALLKNPQYAPEVTHVLFGIMILGGFLTAGISAWQIMKKRDVQVFKKSIQIGLLIAVPLAIIQPTLGDNQIYATAELQAMKFAAAEAQFHTEGDARLGAPWIILGWADREAQKTYGPAIPGLGSYFGTGKFTGSAPGMVEVAQAYHAKYDPTVAASYQGRMDYYPPVNLLFWCLRLMVFIGYFLAIFGVLALILLHLRGKAIEEHPRILKILGVTMWLPYLTLICGWVLAEVGRYPFVVYGLFTHLDAVSPNMTPAKIITSLIIYVLLDLMLILTMLVISRRIVRKGAPSIDDKYREEQGEPDFFGKGAESNV